MHSVIHYTRPLINWFSYCKILSALVYFCSMAAATLPMYDFPEIEESTDEFYNCIRIESNNLGLPLPNTLTRSTKFSNRDLLLSQTCGYPLVVSSENYQVVAVPNYDAKGCHDFYYRSVIIVHKDSNIHSLHDLNEKTLRIAASSRTSCSGCLLMAATFGQTILENSLFTFTGAHEKSIACIDSKECDIAAIDCVTFSLLSKYRHAAVKNIRVLGYTMACPALPYVTSCHTSNSDVSIIQQALANALLSYGVDKIRQDLLIKGFTYNIPEITDVKGFYDHYIRKLQHLAHLPSAYKLYSHNSENDLFDVDYTLHPIASSIRNNSASGLADGTIRGYLESLQPRDADYIQDILQALKLDATDEEDSVDSQAHGYFVWTTFTPQNKSIRIMYPGGKQPATDYFRSNEVDERNIICFMGTRKAVHRCSYKDIDVVRNCWREDAAMVENLNPDSIFAYATGEVQPGGDWGNVVLLRKGCNAESNMLLHSSASTGSQGVPTRAHSAHKEAIEDISPWYYAELRIHRATIVRAAEASVASEVGGQETGYKVAFQRTLYLKFTELFEAVNEGKIVSKYSTGNELGHTAIATFRTIEIW